MWRCRTDFATPPYGLTRSDQRRLDARAGRGHGVGIAASSRSARRHAPARRWGVTWPTLELSATTITVCARNHRTVGVCLDLVMRRQPGIDRDPVDADRDVRVERVQCRFRERPHQLVRFRAATPPVSQFQVRPHRQPDAMLSELVTTVASFGRTAAAPSVSSCRRSFPPRPLRHTSIAAWAIRPFSSWNLVPRWRNGSS